MVNHTSAGMYTRTLTSASGCDSIATLKLVVNVTLTSTTNIAICTNQVPYSWNGQSYSVAGTYTKTLTSASGCDSIATLNLVVNSTPGQYYQYYHLYKSFAIQLERSIIHRCRHLHEDLTSASGCDSIATLKLVVNATLTSTANTTICTNQLPYSWNGQSYTVAGTYTKTLASASGCDSIAALNLVVNPTLTSTRILQFVQINCHTHGMARHTMLAGPTLRH
jgi:hypothetical protein